MMLVGNKFLENVHVSLIETIIAPSGYNFLPIGNSQSHEKFEKKNFPCNQWAMKLI